MTRRHALNSVSFLFKEGGWEYASINRNNVLYQGNSLHGLGTRVEKVLSSMEALKGSCNELNPTDMKIAFMAQGIDKKSRTAMIESEG